MLKIALNISSKKHETVTDDPSIMIYVNKTENRIAFKIKTAYYLELLTHETMKLHGSTEIKVTNDENIENVPHLEITEVIIVHRNIFNNARFRSLVYICS